MKNKYDIYGIALAKNLYGSCGGVNLHIVTDDKGLEEIKKDPLQDYIHYGVDDVVYAFFTVFKTQIEETEEEVIERHIKEPVLFIEKGEIPKDVKVDFLEQLQESEPILVKY